MKITKELLERYHLGRCTDEEQAAVELWLASDELEYDDALSANGSDELQHGRPADRKTSHTRPEDAVKQEMWRDIAAYMNASVHTSADIPRAHVSVVHPSVAPNKFTLRPTVWVSVAAAALVLFGVGWWGYHTLHRDSNQFNASNTNQAIMLWEEDFFDVTLSRNSSATINLQRENISISGDVLFSPKRDVTLYDKNSKTYHDFRQGEVYYISTDPDTSKLMVYSKTELQYLPPILRKHIRKQFHLT